MVPGSVDCRCGRAGSSHRAPNKSQKRLVGRGDTVKACESQFGDQAYRRNYEERGHHYNVGEEDGSCSFRSVILRSVTPLILYKARKTDEKRCKMLFTSSPRGGLQRVDVPDTPSPEASSMNAHRMRPTLIPPPDLLSLVGVPARSRSEIIRCTCM